jgi:hypothetical protein
MLLTYFLNAFEMVPVAPIITGITLVFTFHMRCISIVRSLYFKILNYYYYCYYYYYYYHYHHHHLQLSCHSVAVVLTPVQTKQIRINIHKRNNTKNTVQTIQNTVNTSTHVTKTPTHYKKIENSHSTHSTR